MKKSGEFWILHNEYLHSLYRSFSIVGQYCSGETCGNVITGKSAKDMGE